MARKNTRNHVQRETRKLPMYGGGTPPPFEMGYAKELHVLCQIYHTIISLFYSLIQKH